MSWCSVSATFAMCLHVMRPIIIKPARTYRSTRMRRSLALSRLLAASFHDQSWADCIIIMSGFSFRKGQPQWVEIRSSYCNVRSPGSAILNAKRSEAVDQAYLRTRGLPFSRESIGPLPPKRFDAIFKARSGEPVRSP